MDRNGPSFANCKTLASCPNGVDEISVNGVDRNQREKINQNPMDTVISGARGSIAERRAAKCGFNAPRINTARFRTASPLASPAARSPCLTIPPGISPTALLDSPIMLPNAQPSPTTGTFSLPFLNDVLNPAYPGEVDLGSGGSSFRFKHNVSSPPNLAARMDVDYRAPVSAEPPMDFEFPAEYLKGGFPESDPMGSATDVKVSNDMIADNNCRNMQHNSNAISCQTPLQKDLTHGEGVGTNHLMEGDQKETNRPAGTVRTSEDGYNWRKYGQKQVKGSEYPRSYYKCTHPNCQVKKKVERSHDGQITEIIYKGTHNHQKPQPSRRAPFASVFSFDEISGAVEGSKSFVKGEGGSVWRNIQMGSNDLKLGSEWKSDGLERTSSTSVVTELSDPLSTTQGKPFGTFESVGTPELSSTVAGHGDEDGDDGATQVSIAPIGDSDDGDESESKRRRTEGYLIETNMVSRAVREPRVVVQIESEVDILDDGYRWRKYGQKVVKGNPNPRSYYKCTSAGCSVRKHVERASHNLKCVITTYEGKHNHEVPAARNSTHVNSGGGGNLPPPTASSQPPMTLPRDTLIQKPDVKVQNLGPCFDRKQELNDDYRGPSFHGSFSGDMKYGAPPSYMYQMKFPPIRNTLAYGAFGMNLNRGTLHQPGSIGSVASNFPISLPLDLPYAANLSLADLDFSNCGKTFGPVQSLLSGQQFKESEMRLLRPKQEQKDDHLYDAALPIVDHASALSSSASSSYPGIMGSFPS